MEGDGTERLRAREKVAKGRKGKKREDHFEARVKETGKGEQEKKRTRLRTKSRGHSETDRPSELFPSACFIQCARMSMEESETQSLPPRMIQTIRFFVRRPRCPLHPSGRGKENRGMDSEDGRGIVNGKEMKE